MGVHDLEKNAEVKVLLGIPEDEPIFIIRAQDDLSYEVIDYYRKTAKSIGASKEFRKGVKEILLNFADWRKIAKEEGRTKIPD
jgi:hypothetical protein